MKVGSFRLGGDGTRLGLAYEQPSHHASLRPAPVCGTALHGGRDGRVPSHRPLERLRLERDGHLKSVRVGTRRRFRLEDLVEYLGRGSPCEKRETALPGRSDARSSLPSHRTGGEPWWTEADQAELDVLLFDSHAATSTNTGSAAARARRSRVLFSFSGARISKDAWLARVTHRSPTAHPAPASASSSRTEIPARGATPAPR